MVSRLAGAMPSRSRAEIRPFVGALLGDSWSLSTLVDGRLVPDETAAALLSRRQSEDWPWSVLDAIGTEGIGRREEAAW